MSELHTGDHRDRLVELIDRWIENFAADNESVVGVDRGTSDDTTFGDPRWYVRILGDDKDFITIWLTLGQRTLGYESYVMPAPEENIDTVYRRLLERNDGVVGAHFSVGAEDAIYLRGELPCAAVVDDELDRVIGTMYAVVEANFTQLLRLGFASRFER